MTGCGEGIGVVTGFAMMVLGSCHREDIFYVQCLVNA